MNARYLSLAALAVLPCLPSCGGGGGGGAQPAGPLVVSVLPLDGATGVSGNTDVVVTFNMPLAKGTVNEDTFVLVQRGGPIIPGDIAFFHVTNLPGGDSLVATFTPAFSLVPCALYDVVIGAGAKDNFGRHVTAFASSFTAAGTNCVPPPPAGPCVDPIPFGTAGSYAVLAGATVTNTGSTTLNGDLGLSPGSAVTGSPAVTGVTNIANPAAVTAKNDLITAYNAAVAAPSTATRVGDIGGEILTAGVYTSSSYLSVASADLVLVGGPNDVFIFQMVSALTVESGRKILLRGVRACNVIWQVGSSAVLKTGVQFVGTILAKQDINLETGATTDGRMLAQTGQVVLDTNFVSVP